MGATPTKIQITEQNLGRFKFLQQVLILSVEQYLNYLSTKHLKNHRYQLAIFAFDYIGHKINLDGVYELNDLDVFKKWMLERGLLNGSMIDVGANIGNHSLYFSKFFHKIYSFEPNPRTFALLQINASLAQNVVCYNFGLSDRAGLAELHTSPSNSGTARIVSGRVDNSQTIELRTLDSIAELGECDVRLIKIDVEGHELSVLTGAKRLIQKCRPIIIFEQNVTEFRHGSSDSIELLKELGYRRFATVERYPNISISVPTFVRVPLTALVRLLFGYKSRVTPTVSFKPKFYSFVVAIPNHVGE